jgi:archaellum component FlaC
VKPELKYFKIIPGELWEEFHEGFGAMQSIFMEYWNESRDYRKEFREFAERTDENFKISMNKYGEISEKLTTILNTLLEESRKTSKLLETIQKESRETREILLENIKLLREAIEKLSR